MNNVILQDPPDQVQARHERADLLVLAVQLTRRPRDLQGV